jgi:hypothetical protein
VRNITARQIAIEWQPGLPIYASEPFLRADGGQYGWIGGTDAAGALVCVLPYSIIRKPGLRMVRFRTATLPMAGELDVQDERSFLNSAVEHFRKTGADMIIPSGNTAIFRTYPDDAEVAPYGTFIKDLTEPADVLLSTIRKTYRQNIRKAVAAGVEIKCGPEYLATCYDLIADTLKRSGSHFMGHADFARRIAALGDHVKVFVAEHAGVVHGCMVAPFSEHTAYNCYAGSRPEPVLGAMHLLHWEAIRQFSAMGVKRFDFQGVRINPDKGSKQEGILTYKQGFGGAFIQGYVWKYPLRRLKAMAYSVAVRLFMGGDLVDVEHRRADSREKASAAACSPNA